MNILFQTQSLNNGMVSIQIDKMSEMGKDVCNGPIYHVCLYDESLKNSPSWHSNGWYIVDSECSMQDAIDYLYSKNYIDKSQHTRLIIQTWPV